MDPITTTIVTALVAGATAALKDTAAQAVKDAYAGLKGVLQRRYPKVDVAQIEANPESAARKALLEEELAETEASQDEEVLAEVQRLLDAIEANPESARTVGVDLGDIRAATVTIRDVSARGGATGFRAKNVETPGDFTAEGIRATGDMDPNA